MPFAQTHSEALQAQLHIQTPGTVQVGSWFSHFSSDSYTDEHGSSIESPGPVGPDQGVRLI